VDGARNNLAWIQCTSTDAAFHDPARGLADALPAARLPDAPIELVDTLAACHAANADFAKAVTAQRDAIAKLRALGATAEQVAPFELRLASYERGEVVREAPELPQDGDPTVEHGGRPEEVPPQAAAAPSG
jgi:ATP-dependent Clp protease ATP-binding subunit ClpA